MCMVGWSIVCMHVQVYSPTVRVKSEMIHRTEEPSIFLSVSRQKFSGKKVKDVFILNRIRIWLCLLRLGLSLAWNSPSMLGGLVTESQGTTYLWLLSAGITHISCLAFYTGARDLNLGPWTCLVSTYQLNHLPSPYFHSFWTDCRSRIDRT